METTVRELERLKFLRSGGAPINPLVGDFLSLDSGRQQDVVVGMSDAELEALADDLERQIHEDHRIAQQLEIALMQEEILLKRMAGPLAGSCWGGAPLELPTLGFLGLVRPRLPTRIKGRACS